MEKANRRCEIQDLFFVLRNEIPIWCVYIYIYILPKKSIAICFFSISLHQPSMDVQSNEEDEKIKHRINFNNWIKNDKVKVFEQAKHNLIIEDSGQISNRGTKQEKMNSIK